MTSFDSKYEKSKPLKPVVGLTGGQSEQDIAIVAKPVMWVSKKEQQVQRNCEEAAVVPTRRNFSEFRKAKEDGESIQMKPFAKDTTPVVQRKRGEELVQTKLTNREMTTLIEKSIQKKDSDCTLEDNGDCCTEKMIENALNERLKDYSQNNINNLLDMPFAVYDSDGKYCCCVSVCRIIPPFDSGKQEILSKNSDCNCVIEINGILKNGIEEYNYEFHIEEVDDENCRLVG